MALVNGTNFGLVTTAPTADPTGPADTVIDNLGRALKITVGASDIDITEIGWYCSGATQESNFEVGIYDHDAGGDAPDNLLASNTTNAKGTDAGWKTSALSYTLTASTIYWLAVQLDDTVTKTDIDGETNAGFTSDNLSAGATELPDPWSGDGSQDRTVAIYALYEAEEEPEPDPETGIGTGGKSSRFIRTAWPNEEGLTAGTQTQTGREMNLAPEERSLIQSKDTVGL